MPYGGPFGLPGSLQRQPVGPGIQQPHPVDPMVPPDYGPTIGRNTGGIQARPLSPGNPSIPNTTPGIGQPNPVSGGYVARPNPVGTHYGPALGAPGGGGFTQPGLPATNPNPSIANPSIPNTNPRIPSIPNPNPQPVNYGVGQPQDPRTVPTGPIATPILSGGTYRGAPGVPGPGAPPDYGPAPHGNYGAPNNQGGKGRIGMGRVAPGPMARPMPGGMPGSYGQ